MKWATTARAAPLGVLNALPAKGGRVNLTWPHPDGADSSDRRNTARLQASHQLSDEAAGYICGALLEWVLLGEPWPRDPAEPVAGPECDHLEALVQITERWVGRSVAAVPISRRFEMAMVGRELSYAIRCQTDPQQLAESIEREMLLRMPWLASPPAPVLFPGGSVL